MVGMRVVGQAFSLRTGFSRSFRSGAESPAQPESLPTTTRPQTESPPQYTGGLLLLTSSQPDFPQSRRAQAAKFTRLPQNNFILV